MDPNIDSGSNVRSDVIMNPDRVKATQIGMDWQENGPWTPTWLKVADKTTGTSMAFDGIRSHGHQLRPWLR